MKKKPFAIAFLTLALICSSCDSSNEKGEDMMEGSAEMTESMMIKTKTEILRHDMRKLWEDHVAWTRNVIFCIADDLPGADQAVDRLMKNQDDIGGAIASFYGEDAGMQLTELLHEHITGAAEVVTCAKTNDTEGLKIASEKWQDNADEISEFLSNANPEWKLKDMKKMMDDHLKLTTDEAVARITKDYDADVKAYDKVHDEILMMADMLSDGIIKQFPDKFK